MVRRTSHEAFKKKAFADPSVKAEYDALEGEFNLISKMIKARQKAHKTQAEVAEAMGTTTSVVGRLECGGGLKKHSPSVASLKRYAKAVGCDLRIEFVHKRSSSSHSGKSAI